jgi:hypothetical protein
MITTVGELKKALENFDDNMLLDLYACCYDRNNYTCIKRDRWNISDNEPLEICVSEDNGRLRIENNSTSDMELSD